jgi:hypothetical protein
MTCRILSTNEPIRITIQSGHRVLRTIGHTNTQQKGRLDTCHVYTSQSEFEEQYSYEYHKRERGVAMIRRRRIQNEWQLLRTAGHLLSIGNDGIRPRSGAVHTLRVWPRQHGPGPYFPKNFEDKFSALLDYSFVVFTATFNVLVVRTGKWKHPWRVVKTFHST